MNYSNIISDFTWSYSRLTQFEMCPYGFLLHYIEHAPKKSLFFSDYGSFVHKLLELYLRGELKREELPQVYLTDFRREVKGKAPNQNIFKNYFQDGLRYLTSIDFPYPAPIAVEEKVDFFIGENQFTGIIDVIAEDKEGKDLVIVDHKSAAIKMPSGRAKPTKGDIERMAKLSQLYLYAIPIKEKFGKYPSRLEFNCFRTGQLISEPFNEDDLKKAEEWANQTIQTITDNEDWSPKLDYWKCRYLCDHSDSCEYFQMNRG